VVSAKQENFIKSQYLYNVPVVIIAVVQQVGAVKIYVAAMERRCLGKRKDRMKLSLPP
jgi:hypothetical protein